MTQTLDQAMGEGDRLIKRIKELYGFTDEEVNLMIKLAKEFVKNSSLDEGNMFILLAVHLSEMENIKDRVDEKR